MPQVVLNTWLSFPLPLVPVFRLLRCNHGQGDGAIYSAPRQAAMRTAVVLVCGGVGAVLPSFALAMGVMVRRSPSVRLPAFLLSVSITYVRQRLDINMSVYIKT